MEEAINLKDIFGILKKRRYFIGIFLILFITIIGVISYVFMTPIYKSETQILINLENNGEENTRLQTIHSDLQLINTYSVIIRSPAVLNEVIEKLDLDTTPKSLSERIIVKSEPDLQVINLAVQDVDPEKARIIANTTSEIFQKEIKKIMGISNVKIISPAINKDILTPIKPNPILNMAIAAIIGFMISIGLVILLEHIDTSFKTEQEVEELLGKPIIGFISTISYERTSSKIHLFRKKKL
ncbi:YveK family protein [Rummeliibacillus pycnus]|uniref:YveK family protein n=1 Tax=Rummeliibacillus pycnus TaxID=101070 RepID=UPI003D2BA857